MIEITFDWLKKLKATFRNNTYYSMPKRTLQNTYCITNGYEVFQNNEKYQFRHELIHVEITKTWRFLK